MSFELTDMEHSSADSFMLDGTWHALPIGVPSVTSIPQLSAARTLPVFSIPPPAMAFQQMNRSYNLNIFSPNFDLQPRQSISYSSSRTSLVEQSQRKNQAPKWRPDEDYCLVELVNKYGPRKWKDIAQQIASKTNCALRYPDAVSQRWSRVINPQINKSKWSQDEVKRLISAVKECQPKYWKEIAEKLPGRTDIQVRYQLSKIREILIAQGIQEDYLPQ